MESREQKWDKRMTGGSSRWVGGTRSPVAPCHILTCWCSINLLASPDRKVWSHTHTHSCCVSQCVVSRQDSGTAQFLAKSICIVGLSVLVCMFFFLQRDSSQENKDRGHLWCSIFSFFSPKSELHLGGNLTMWKWNVVTSLPADGAMRMNRERSFILCSHHNKLKAQLHIWKAESS